MAFKGFSGLRRDYLAKELLIEFLRDPGVVSKLLINDEAKLIDPDVVDGVEWFDDLLVTRCVDLADGLIEKLGNSQSISGNFPVNDLQEFPDPSPLVLDGDLS